MSAKMVKLLSVVLVTAMVTGLVACGGGGGAAPTSAPAVPTQPSAPRVLKIWHYEAADSAMGASWDDAMKDFQAKYPDVKVEFESRPLTRSNKRADDLELG